jgi:hypothetical protein
MYDDDETDDLSDSTATRRSTRVNKRPSQLRYDDSYLSDGYESEVTSVKTSRSSAKPRTPKAKEYFPSVDKDTEFAKRHHFWCMYSTDMSAIQDDERSSTMCQGCSFMYHVECLGDKANRLRVGHNVIVLDERSGIRTCLLQCGRCSGGGKNGAITMRCTGCGEIGDRCGKIEHPEKVEASDEMDVDISSEEKSQREEKLLQGWNDASKLMFRCIDCHRGYHFHHLPPAISKPKQNTDNLEEIVVQKNESQLVDDVEMEIDNAGVEKSAAPTAETLLPNPAAEGETSDKRSSTIEPPNDLTEQETLSSRQWRCTQCTQYMDKKVEKVLGWRLIASPSYSADDVPNDFLREYLIKFENDSYSCVLWVPGTWLSGTAFAMKRNFDAEQLASIKSSEDVIPDTWLRADIIFDVRYEGDLSRDQMHFRTQDEELTALSKVTEALCKFQQLRYEECTALIIWFLISSDLGCSAETGYCTVCRFQSSV